MNRDKKIIEIVFLSIALVVSGSVTLILISLNRQYPIPTEEKITLRAGTYNELYDLDPVRIWDYASNDVIQQVCEGLYQYNLSDPDLGIIPMLAADYGLWDVTGTRFTVPLRRNVFFHDGTPFSAESVKWNFERINWFFNGTGTLNLSVGLSPTHFLYEFPNGTTILDPITPVTINSDYSVTINLRAPYAILESLLCYVTAYILSPSSTSKYEYIDTTTGDIVGTGPFVYDYYIEDTEIKFYRWARYWRTGAYFEELNFWIIIDATDSYNAIKGHTIDYLIGSPPSFISSNYSDPTLTYRSDIPSLSYSYLGMNNEKINQTWRQAISYAINYSFMIEELQDGTVYRSNGPIAPNFPMSDPSIQAATYNLTKAREIVVSMGFGDTGWTDAQWQAASFAAWNFTYYIGNAFREDFGILLMNNLDLIGIEIFDQGGGWSDFHIWRPSWPPDDINLHHLYWINVNPYYLSPYEMIFRLFSNRSTSNFVNYHNHTVEMWLDEVLSETNATKRAELYSKILHQIVEVDMPHVFGYHSYRSIVHSYDLKGVAYNAMGSFYAYPMYRDSNS